MRPNDDEEDLILLDEVIVEDTNGQVTANGKSLKTNTSFFHRGSNLFCTVRTSLRKMGYRPQKKSTVIDLDPLIPQTPLDKVTTTTIQEVDASLNLKLEDMNSNDSQDSGLGEDSDLGEASVVTSPRTPPPCSVPGILISQQLLLWFK